MRTSSPGGHSVWVPPDPISNSEVKPFSADDSVVFRHVKVGHRRVLLSVPLDGWEKATSGVAFFRFHDMDLCLDVLSVSLATLRVGFVASDHF